MQDRRGVGRGDGEEPWRLDLHDLVRYAIRAPPQHLSAKDPLASRSNAELGTARVAVELHVKHGGTRQVGECRGKEVEQCVDPAGAMEAAVAGGGTAELTRLYSRRKEALAGGGRRIPPALEASFGAAEVDGDSGELPRAV